MKSQLKSGDFEISYKEIACCQPLGFVYVFSHACPTMFNIHLVKYACDL